MMFAIEWSEQKMKIVWGIVAALIVALLGGLVFIYSGIYDVAASVPHNEVTAWILSTTMQRSVAMRADAAAAPQLTDAQAHEGYRFYSETCIYCHGAPGRDPTDIGKGLNPEPPYLPDTVGRWSSAEIYWIVKNGVKMTGMPAFGSTHKDAEIWNVVAFVQRLPKMSPEEFNQIERESNASPEPNR